MKRCFAILLSAALICAMNAHLSMLQVVAWGGMVVKYSRDASIQQALQKTFDGEHPCKLCCAIQKASAPAKHTITLSQTAPDVKTVCLQQKIFVATSWMVERDLAAEHDFKNPPSGRPAVPPPRV